MISAADALKKAESVTSWTVGMCDNFVANMYGYSSSGYTTALVHWNSIASGEKHPGDMNAPAGALMFWGGGQGHVAISDGQGNIYSTDMPSPGVVSKVPADTPTKTWGKPYLGWSVPVFQGQTGSVGAVGTVTPASAVSAVTSGVPGLSSDMAERLGLILLGAVMIVIGVWKMVGDDLKFKKGRKDATDSKGSKDTTENA